MTLNTINRKELTRSIANMFCTDTETILNFFEQYGANILEERYSEYTIDRFNLDLIENFCNCPKINSIDKVTIHHITPRENDGILLSEDILTLPQALVCNTALSMHLKEKGFEFEFSNNRIAATRYDEIVELSKLNQSNLLQRLGGENSLNDFNINGYLFVSDFVLNFCRGWLGSPEILKSIATAYNDRSIADDYADKCRNYLVSFNVGLENIDIELKDANISSQEKSELLVKYCVNALAYWLQARKPSFDFCNPVIMLKRNYIVPKTDIVQIKRLKIENNRVKIME